MDNQPQPPIPPTPRRLRRVLLVALAVLLVLIGAVVIELVLARSNPSWWRDVKPNDPRTAFEAEQVEDGMLAHASLARPADPASTGAYRSQEWSVSLSDHDADAWLATRLQQWMSSRAVKWPPDVGDVQVGFVDGGVRLGAKVRSVGQVVTASVVPEIRDGALWVRTEGMTLGRAPMPSSFVLSRIRGISGASDLADILEGKRPALKEPALKLEDGRVVRLMGIAVREGRIEVRCRTEKK